MTEFDTGAWRLGAWLEKLRRGPRGIWSNAERVHIQVLAIGPFARARYAARLREEIEAIPGVRWARLNGRLGRLIVGVEGSGPAVEEARLVDRVEAVERELGAGPAFAAPAPPYPAATSTWISPRWSRCSTGSRR
jgi:hypothetical protein